MGEPFEGSCDLLLTGGSVVTVDDARRVLEPGAVAIAGDRIVAVGTPDELARIEARRTVDCTGKAVLPGFVDCHQHQFQYLARGLGDGLPIWPWLTEFMFPVAAEIMREDAVAGARLASIEAVRSGVTAVLDHHYAPTDVDATLGIAGAIESVGLRGVVARGMAGDLTEVAREGGLTGHGIRYRTDEELEFSRACLEARPPGSHVAVWPAPLNVIYVGQDIVRRSVELAREFGAGWHTHCSESREDASIYGEAYGSGPVEWLHQEGLTGPDAVLAHGVWLLDDEVAQLGESSTAVSYCPLSHEYMAVGVMRLGELRQAGAVIGLGSDGASGHHVDHFECMKQAVLLQRVHHLDPTASTVEEAIELATREGARALQLDAGSLEPGRLADIAVVNLDAPHTTPNHRTVATLVYCAGPGDVEMTIVGGRVVYEDGRCVLVDERDAMREARERADALLRRAGVTGLLDPWRETRVESGLAEQRQKAG